MAYPYTSYQAPYQQGYYPYQQQPVMQQQPVQQQSYIPSTNQSGIIWISGESEAALFPIAPNSAVALWSRDGKTIFLKSADATGKPNMRVYDLVERAQSASDGTSEKDGKMVTYATKDDVGAVVGAIKGIDGIIASLKADVETMKGDLYGAVGKRKTVKKADPEMEE